MSYNRDGKVSVIEMKNIKKSFNGARALDSISFNLYEGEICSIVGENGAGKSTLVKILSGAHSPDEGDILIDGKHYKTLTPKNASDIGIGIIYQENLLVPTMNVVENIFVGNDASKGIFMDYKNMIYKTQEAMAYFGVNLNIFEKIENLSVSDLQFVKILKALVSNPRVLIMDEPTSMFNVRDASRVLNLVKKISDRNISVIYISHFLKEVKDISDRVVVIRDGKDVITLDNKNHDIDLKELTKYMVGRSVDMFYSKEKHDIGSTILEVSNLKLHKNSRPISFELRKGEVLGFAGMVGSGRTEIIRALVGADKPYHIEIKLNGEDVSIKNPKDSIKRRIAYITEDRQKLGLMLNASVVENLTIVGLKNKIKDFFINIKNNVKLVLGIIDCVKIKISSPFIEVKYLSGGNQQKVVLGKWLFADADLFVLDEPTRGIDVSAKAEFYKIMSGLTKEGKSIIMVSSDMPEIISMSDRVAVVRKGDITKVLEKDEISEHSIIMHALGVS